MESKNLQGPMSAFYLPVEDTDKKEVWENYTKAILGQLKEQSAFITKNSDKAKAFKMRFTIEGVI